MKTRICAILLVLALVLSMSTMVMAAEAGAKVSLSVEREGFVSVVTVGITGAEGVTNGRVAVSYDPEVVSLEGSRVVGKLGAASINDQTEGQVSLAWVGSDLEAEAALVELTFVTLAAEDTSFTAEALELYAKETEVEAQEADLDLPWNPYTDIDGHWAEDDIIAAFYLELMIGTGNGKFSPEATLDRAMFVTMLYRLEGEPSVEGDVTFADVPEDEYYTDAVVWASENEIVYGVSETQFAPHLAISRQELATMLYRYAAYLNGGEVEVTGNLENFKDANMVDDWAVEAMVWAAENEILLGFPGGYLMPRANSTRAQAATILVRCLEQ